MTEVTSTKAYKSALNSHVNGLSIMNASLYALEVSRDNNPALTLADIEFIEDAIKYKRTAIANHINHFNDQWS